MREVYRRRILTLDTRLTWHLCVYGADRHAQMVSEGLS